MTMQLTSNETGNNADDREKCHRSQALQVLCYQTFGYLDK